MATIKLVIFGCIEICTCAFQLFVTAVCTLTSIFLLFKTYSILESSEFGLFLVPTLNLVMATLILFVSVGQILSARQLIIAGRINVDQIQMENIKSNWKYWNKRSFLGIFLWFPYIAVWTFIKYQLSLAILLACFSVIFASRLVLTCGIYTLSCTNQVDPSALRERPIEMHQIRAEDGI